jgi:hypothetical protein
MRTTTALLVLLALALPAAAMPHPCEVEVAKMKGDLEAIRGAVATIEGLRPSDNQRLMLASTKAKYDLELLRTTEALAQCERLVRAESPGSTPSPASGVAVSASPPTAASASPAVPAPAPAAIVPVAPAVETARPAAPSPAAAAPAAPCLTGCGKDTDCKGDRICVNGACQDPPSR